MPKATTMYGRNASPRSPVAGQRMQATEAPSPKPTTGVNQALSSTGILLLSISVEVRLTSLPLSREPRASGSVSRTLASRLVGCCGELDSLLDLVVGWQRTVPHAEDERVIQLGKPLRIKAQVRPARIQTAPRVTERTPAIDQLGAVVAGDDPASERTIDVQRRPIVRSRLHESPLKRRPSRGVGNPLKLSGNESLDLRRRHGWEGLSNGSAAQPRAALEGLGSARAFLRGSSAAAASWLVRILHHSVRPAKPSDSSR